MSVVRVTVTRPPCRLIVACEGADDEAFLSRMLDHLSVAPYRVDRYQGKPQLPRYLRGLRDSTDFETVRAVGIIRDADNNAAGAWQSVSDLLRRLDFPRPRAASAVRTGVCAIDGIARAFGVFIMPGGDATGALEDLCLRGISEGESLACVDEFLTCVTGRTGVACHEQDVPKARLNAWLASRHNPSLRIGHAVAAGVLPPDSPAFGPIKRFLTDLAAAGEPETPAT
jgi:hypothetical protein